MISVHTLPNGVRVVMEVMQSVRSISFGLWVKTGSRHETESTNGISHFTEHMFFKGTEKRSALCIAETMDAVGGQINAFTTKDCTCYHVRTLDTHFDTALDVLTDMFFNSKFDPNDIVKERNVILEEISMYEDTPEDVCMEMLNAKVFPQNPLGMNILGLPDTVSSFEQKDFKTFLDELYSPENTIIAIAGNFNEKDILDKLTALYGNWKSKTSGKEMSKAVYTPGFGVKEKDIEQVHLCIGLPGLPISLDESHSIAVMNTIFGGGMSSRLFQKIREERGLVYTVYSYHANYTDTGVFTIYAGLSPSHVPEVLDLVSREIKGLFTNKITSEQLAKTKEQIKSNFILSLESSGHRMSSIARTQVALGISLTTDDIIKKIDAVTLDSIYDVCDKIFKLDQMSLSLVGKNVESVSIDSINFEKA